MTNEHYRLSYLSDLDIVPVFKVIISLGSRARRPVSACRGAHDWGSHGATRLPPGFQNPEGLSHAPEFQNFRIHAEFQNRNYRLLSNIAASLPKLGLIFNALQSRCTTREKNLSGATLLQV